MRDCESCKNHTDKGCTKWKCEFEPTTKNDLGVDYISKQEVVGLMMHIWGKNHSGDDAMQECIDAIREMPSVIPQEQQSFEWCDTCKEYDQEKHCCHRWTKVIRNTVEEMKQEQEPKTGHWNDISKYENIAWQCSECGRFTTMKHNYCPNCGAKMVEPESED